ncbi:hypothetical protein HY792_03515 [Candidatus Desantisbacteria bacterium]|nr:hypothetical protein [Candidatus Desantisbacteria bacterium]
MRIAPISDYMPGGLLVTYRDAKGSRVHQIDPEINHDWKTGSPHSKIHYDCFTARWEGKLQVDKSNEYTLYTHTDEGVRVWVDGKLLIDCSRNNVEREDNAKTSLTKGLHDIVMEYNENYAGATAKLSWSSSSMSKRIISSANLYSPTQIANNVSPFDDLSASINKRIGQSGWEDVIEQVSVAGTGYKNLDYNHDNKIDTKDLGLVSPELQDTIEKLNNNIGKKEGNVGWEDSYREEKHSRRVGWRRRWQEYTTQVLIQEGTKRLDLNRDGIIDTNDIFSLWTEKGNPEVSLNLLKKAFNRMAGDLNWEDLLRPIMVKGAKNWDFTVDGQVDKEDLKMYFGAMYKNGTLIQAEGDKNIYLMMNGEKIFVPDKQILEVLSLDKNGTTIIESKELELIPTNYMDGTILKDEQTKLYLAESGCRRPVEKNTLTKLGLGDGFVAEIKSSNAPPLGAEIKPIPYEPNRVLKSLEDGKMYLTFLDKGVKIVDGVGYTDYTLQKIGIPDAITRDALGLGTKDTTITIRAKGDAARGTYPLIQLRVDGQVAKEWFVTDNWTNYSVTLPLSNGKHSIDVVYSNDQDISTRINTWEEKTGKWWKGTSRTIVHTDTVHDVIADRTLWVDYIRVGEQSVQAEDVSKVSYDKGESNKFENYFDGKDLTTATEKMEWAGALRFTTDVNNNIWMTNNELKEITDMKELVVDDKGNAILENNAPKLRSMNLDKILYANGSVLRADGRLYLVSFGIGREIKDDQTTLEALGIDANKIVNVSKDKLPVISQETAVEIKYANGTVLKDTDGKYYLVQAGTRMLIPDKTTLEAMGLSQNNNRDLSKEQMDKIPAAATLPTIKYANQSLVKGSGETVYMVMGGRKMAVPEGETTFNGYGLDRNSVINITDEELVSLPTDDGLERIEVHDTQTIKNKTFQRLLSAAVKFIPVWGQVYTAVSALTGRDLITNDRMSAADMGLGLLGGIGSLANTTASAGKLVSIGKNLGTLGSKLSDLRTASIAIRGRDFLDKDQKVGGIGQILGGISFLGTTGFDKINGDKISKLSQSQVNGLSNLYRAGAMLDGGVSAAEKESLAIGMVSPYFCCRKGESGNRYGVAVFWECDWCWGKWWGQGRGAGAGQVWDGYGGRGEDPYGCSQGICW